MENKIKFIANAARWFDRVNGNTYHSVHVIRTSDGKELRVPMQYGYGDCYRQTALDAMAKAGWIPAKYALRHENGSSALLTYETENGYPIQWNVSDGLKRDCMRNGGE